MAMVMDLDFSNLSYSAGTTELALTDHGCNWSPVVDWEALSGGEVDDFHVLLDSIMDDRLIGQDDCGYNTLSPEYNTGMRYNDGDDKGLRLVHLLMAAAEALDGGNNCRELARVILVRLKELVSPTDGTNMERLAAHFTDALQGLLDGGADAAKHCRHEQQQQQNHRQADVLAALQLLQDMSPYVKFGHFTANQAILEAVARDQRVHIVDYDIMEGIQWASLMQALVSRKEGPPTPHLRITALSRIGSSRRSIGTVQETGRRLTAFAASIGQPFSFHQCRVDADETFKPSSLKLVKGEALIMNCMLHLPHFSYRAADSVASFLSGAGALAPRIITLVEEEIGATNEVGFVGRFMECLHHYSAVYDSFEAGFPMQGRARALVERVFLGPSIARSLDREAGCSWGHWLGAVGLFRPSSISFANRCQARLLLALYNDGYRVEELKTNKLILGWKSRYLLSVSIWTTQDSIIC